MKSKILQIEAYNQTDQILYVCFSRENKGIVSQIHYKYFNISKYHYDKIRYFISQEWIARAIGYIKHFKYERVMV